MGRKAKFPPKIHRHSSGQAFVRIYQSGKDRNIYLGPHGSPEAQTAYARLIAEMAGNGGLPPVKADAAITVGEVLHRFMSNTPNDYAPDSREPAQFALTFRPLRRLYETLPAADFDSETLLAVQAAMASGSWMNEEEKAEARNRKRPIDWCRNVVNRRIVRIKTAWKWAEEHKLVPKGSYGNLLTVRGLKKKSPKVRHTARRQPSTREQIDAILPHCPAVPAAMLDLQWFSGMRSCEVRIMRTEDVDRSGEVWLYTPSKHKNDWREEEQPRVVPLGPECQRIILPYLNLADPGAYLFQSRPGHCYTDMTYPQSVRRACFKAGVKTVPYCCRHAAKRRIAREAGEEAARAVLGHKSIQTTAHYGGLDTELAAKTMTRCG